MSNYGDRIDVLKNRMRCVDVRAVVKLFDHGPQAPPAVDAKRMRKYLIDRSAWEKETGGKPVAVSFNSIDAAEIRLRDGGKRWRRSATATVDENIAQPQSAGQVVIDLVSASGGGAQFGGYWLLDITTQTKWIVFSPDYIEWQSRGRGQYIPTTPS
jgi:hypothetical protein